MTVTSPIASMLIASWSMSQTQRSSASEALTTREPNVATPVIAPIAFSTERRRTLSGIRVHRVIKTKLNFLFIVMKTHRHTKRSRRVERRVTRDRVGAAGTTIVRSRTRGERMGGNSTGLVPEEIAFLLGAETRVRVLAAFEDGPKRQATAARECGVGRSTVHRCVEGLREHGWVREADPGYALTATGERVLSAYRDFARSVERARAHEPLLRCLEETAVSIPDAALADAELVTASEHDPHAPVVVSADLLRRTDADHVRTAWSGVSPITNDAGEAHLGDGGTVEMVVDRRTLVAARESYFENYQLALASDRVDLHVADAPLRAGVLLAGDRVAVTGYEDGHATVCVHGTSDDLHDCARRLYREIRDRADPVEVRYPTPEQTDDRRSRTPIPDGDGR